MARKFRFVPLAVICLQMSFAHAENCYTVISVQKDNDWGALELMHSQTGELVQDTCDFAVWNCKDNVQQAQYAMAHALMVCTPEPGNIHFNPFILRK